MAARHGNVRRSVSRPKHAPAPREHPPARGAAPASKQTEMHARVRSGRFGRRRKFFYRRWDAASASAVSADTHMMPVVLHKYEERAGPSLRRSGLPSRNSHSSETATAGASLTTESRSNGIIEELPAWAEYGRPRGEPGRELLGAWAVGCNFNDPMRCIDAARMADANPCAYHITASSASCGGSTTAQCCWTT